MTEHPLADLVRRAHEELPYRDLAARAHRAGFDISHSQIQAYERRTVARAPSDYQMRALAAALDIGYETVRAAVFQEFYNYVPRELRQRSGKAGRLAAVVPDDLSPEEELQLMRLIEAWLSSRERNGQ